MNINIYADSVEQDNTSHNNNHDMQEHLGSNDEVINKTKWTPLVGGGQSNKSHRIVKISDERIAFKISLSSIFAYSIFIFAGVVAIVSIVFGPALGLHGTVNHPALGLGMGVLFIGVGIFLLYKGSIQIRFDSRLKAMWHGKVDPDSILNKGSISHYTSLKELHAIQIIQEFIKGEFNGDSRKQSFYSYELNLIMHDGKRVNVLDHGNKKAIFKQANAIAQMFHVPIWDGCRSFPSTQRGLGGIAGKIFRFGNMVRNLMWIASAIFFVYGFYYLYTKYVEAQNDEKQFSSLTQEQKSALAQTLSYELVTKAKENKLSMGMLDNSIHKGAYVNEKDELGRTALFYEVMYKNFDMINSLIKKGADIDVVDNEGKGLKDLLDPIKDKFLYYYIVDAQLRKDAQSRGKMLISVDRKFDPAGNLISQQVHER
ncbi:hypothetical protein [Sulfurimonas sp.]|uniref:hypothetical protein n=1 Tax=Sulfurimonas sp. TaxID=2022749 RepID=UPI003D12A4F5